MDTLSLLIKVALAVLVLITAIISLHGGTWESGKGLTKRGIFAAWLFGLMFLMGFANEYFILQQEKHNQEKILALTAGNETLLEKINYQIRWDEAETITVAKKNRPKTIIVPVGENVDVEVQFRSNCLSWVSSPWGSNSWLQYGPVELNWNDPKMRRYLGDKNTSRQDEIPLKIYSESDECLVKYVVLFNINDSVIR